MAAGNEENNQEKNEESIDILFDLARNEYDNETNRKRDLETRAGILIALVGALIGLFFTVIDISIVSKGKTVVETVIYSILALSYLIPLSTGFLSLKSFINTIITREYTRMDVNGVTDQIAALEKQDLSFRLATSYKNAVINNEKLNDEKASYFNDGIDKLFNTFIAFLLIYIVHIILKQLV
ncbi:hypothetical protein [Niallia taxi]|uniref:hypothetical protein n=1 Tax=Niallia taxi TaxID=2499688 RepID=UPI002E1B5367|nr:hypothetical protein [Niallia taxi]